MVATSMTAWSRGRRGHSSDTNSANAVSDAESTFFAHSRQSLCRRGSPLALEHHCIMRPNHAGERPMMSEYIEGMACVEKPGSNRRDWSVNAGFRACVVDHDLDRTRRHGHHRLLNQRQLSQGTKCANTVNVKSLPAEHVAEEMLRRQHCTVGEA
jgi:hypothetical protein